MGDYRVYENGLDLTDEVLDCVLMGIQALGIKAYLKDYKRDEIEKRKLEKQKRRENMSDEELAQESLKAYYRRNKR